jgi:hypothetical protein
MIERPTACKMMTAPKAVKTAKDGLQDQKAIKGQGKAFGRVLGDPTACNEGIKQ